ncbi:MAG: NAD(P)-binding domain-containing protein [Lewinellaceae bacterium]|nr:NAD(P)-binding domain-containing protein [Lewinellaceae bacterium]
MMSKKVGVIGSGVVGKVLANGFLKHGYDVMIGTRDPGKLDEWKQTSGGQVGNLSEAAQFGDLVVFAVAGTAAEEALQLTGVDHLAGKTVLDATNPIAAAPPENGVIQYFTGPNESLMERLQKLAPGARFVKAFSCVGNALMVNPQLPGGPPTMFICGNDTNAKAEASQVLATFGFEVEDMGGVEGARAIEPLAILWCIPGFLQNRWVNAFKLLKP